MSEIKKVKHILIIEDHTLMRLALLEIIKDKLTEALAQGAGTLEAALSLIDAQRFDIIFIDPGLPGINPTNIGERKEIIKKIIEVAPDSKHFVFTGFFTTEEENICRGLNVTAYISKIGFDHETIPEIFKRIKNGDKFITLEQETPPASEYYYSKLTPREQYIIQKMLQRSPRTIKKQVIEMVAEQLNIDEDTVTKYYKSARSKLKKAHLLPKFL